MTTIKERPILFAAPMVRAILEGRKTVTRRAVKPQPEVRMVDMIGPMLTFKNKRGGHWLFPNAKAQIIADCPYGNPGDRLWVRETFTTESNRWADDPYSPPHKDGRPTQRYEDDKWDQPHYKATDEEPELWYDDRDSPGCRWKPSIHMPRWASRILLEITDVRVERLQDISEDQAQAEGVRLMRDGSDTWVSREGPGNLVTPWPTAKEAFSDLWNSINGPHAWVANPWVWAVSFKRVTP